MQRRFSTNGLQLRWLAVITGFMVFVGFVLCVVLFSKALKGAHEIRFAPNANNASVNVRSK